MKADKILYLFALIVFLGWGLSVFADKLATNKLGNRSIIPVVISFIPSLLVLFFFLFFSERLGFNKEGVFWITVSTFLNDIAIIFYYLLFVKSEVTWAVPITALYPLLPVILGVIILNEELTLTRVMGIGLSLLAIVFLNL